MKKIILQGIFAIVLFLSTWFILSQIDWVTALNIKKVSDKTEEKLGNLFWEIFQNSGKENKNEFVHGAIDSMITKICTANEINRELIKIHILNNKEINAFALPNGHLVIYDGLILNSDNQEQLCGVLCHEVAHIQLNHVMKKLTKEVGLSVLISMTIGNNGSEIIMTTAKKLSSTAFDRGLEKEADIKAVDYLIKAKINPEPFANFLLKLSAENTETSKYLTWLSTHPESMARAQYILEYCKSQKGITEPILAEETWVSLKNLLEE